MSNNNSGTGLHFLLGAEYERKKQKLQEELQMDYKRYIEKKRDSTNHNKSQAHGLYLPIAARTSEKPEEPTDVDKNKDHSLPESYRPAEPSISWEDAATLIRSEKGRKTWDLKQQRAPHKQGKGAVTEGFIPTTIAETSATVFATGLLIGHSEDQAILQKKKEVYKQALLSQIAEQRENKRKEKILDLKVAATGATDPHKFDMFKPFGSEHHTYEKWKQKISYKPETGAIVVKDNPELKLFPPGRPTEAIPSPMQGNNCALQSGTNHGNYSPDVSVEEYNKIFSHMIGDVTTKRVCSVPPPLPPRVEHIYKTPHDENYIYYGRRHPLEPILFFDQNNEYKPEGPQELEGSPQQKTTNHEPRRPTQADFGQSLTIIPDGVPSESDRQKIENYQQAFKQQLKDKAEHTRKEREEQKRYNAKIMNEMMSYNTWGRCGGGAPLIDQNGNLISNLDQMHKLNAAYYRNSNLNGESTPFPGLGQLGYKEQEHLQRQDDWIETPKQQIEEKKRKKAEEREREKFLEEQEEKRLAEDRARLQEYEIERQKNRRKGKTNDDLLASEGKDDDKGKIMTAKSNNGRNNLNDWLETLKQQIEEKKQKKAEEREREKILEERDEKRLAEDRARLQKEYEKERQRNRRNVQRKTNDDPLASEGKDNDKGKIMTAKSNNGRNNLDDCIETLKQQIEEKKQKEAEEREREKILEERDEKRLAEDRARLQKEYEKERQKNRRNVQVEENGRRLAKERERQNMQRGPSPPIPTLQHKPTNTNVPSFPDAPRQLTPKTAHLEEASQNQPEQILEQYQYLEDEKQEVLTELRTLQKILKHKKKLLETKCMQTNPGNEPYRSVTRHQRQREQAGGDAALRGLREENVHSSTQSLHSMQGNLLNLKEFNQLKYRDTSSREALLHNYPDPPTNGSSLDIQQQALLREQRRKLELLKRRERDYRFMASPGLWAEQEDLYEDKMDPLEPDAPLWPSDTIVNKVQQRHEHPSEHQCDDEADPLSGCSAPESPVSVGTVTMEPWLQTSTSEPEHSGFRRAGRKHL